MNKTCVCKNRKKSDDIKKKTWKRRETLDFNIFPTKRHRQSLIPVQRKIFEKFKFNSRKRIALLQKMPVKNPWWMISALKSRKMAWRSTIWSWQKDLCSTSHKVYCKQRNATNQTMLKSYCSVPREAGTAYLSHRARKAKEGSAVFSRICIRITAARSELFRFHVGSASDEMISTFAQPAMKLFPCMLSSYFEWWLWNGL